MNGLPTFDRIAHYKGGTIACNLCGNHQVHCPVCDAPLSSFHFFSSKCYQIYSKKIFEWCEKKGLKVRYRICFTNDNSNYDLIYVNTIWKIFQSARHSTKTNITALNDLAKNMFKRELQIAKVLYPSTYVTPNVKNVELKSLPEIYSLVDLVN